jgi:hypothetical protein
LTASQATLPLHITQNNAEEPMLTIRLQKTEWAKAWRAMIEVAPVRLVADDPIYEVEPIHLELLTARGFTYEVLPARPRRPESPSDTHALVGKD